MKKRPSDITKQADGAGGIKWAKDVYEQEIAYVAAKEPITVIKLIRKLWSSGFGEGQRHRETQIIEFLEGRIKNLEANSPEFREANHIAKFVKGFSLYHIDD